MVEAAAKEQEALQDALLAERAADLRDVGRRVLAQLCGVETPNEPDQPYILVMDEVGPSDVARLDPTRVAGILTARGGATAHSAIVASGLGHSSAGGCRCRGVAAGAGHRPCCWMASAVACTWTLTPLPCNGQQRNATPASSASRSPPSSATNRRRPVTVMPWKCLPTSAKALVLPARWSRAPKALACCAPN